VVGAGPTGVELAGTLGEITRDTLRFDFRSFDPSQARIILLEGADRVLPTFSEASSRRARKDLEKLGVKVRTGTMVDEIEALGVQVSSAGESEWIPARTILWGAGVQPTPLARILAESTGAELDRQGRVVVGADLSLPRHREIMVLGDMASCAHHRTGDPLPGVAAVAMQQGLYAAKRIKRELAGKKLRPFRYRDYGRMATIGRAAAVAEMGGIRLAGYPGWLAWLFIHLVKMVEFSNRILVLIQWAVSYFTYRRTARLIMGAPDVPVPCIGDLDSRTEPGAARERARSRLFRAGRLP
jgi:NADH:ubiquinone reductase (H+-translocating)